MIDDYATAVQLIEKMEAYLPIPANPTPELARTLRPRGVKIHPNRAVFIKRVFYMGNEGGICCDVTPSEMAKEAVVVSLTHLRIAPGHPLYRDIVAYQRARVKRIAEQERSGS